MKLRKKLFSISRNIEGTKRIIYILGIRIRYKLRFPFGKHNTLKIGFSKIPGIVENDFCSGCSACYSICAKGAIKMGPNSDGFLMPQIDDKLCTKCGRCRKVCPVINFHETDLPKLDDVVCYAAQASDDIRVKSTSGGVFTVIAEDVLKRGGYVCGAAYSADLRYVRHEIVHSVDELDKLRISKYVQSDLGDVFNGIKNLLKSSKEVLFVGTPCQVAGLKSFLHKDYPTLLLVDLICGGVPSNKTYQQFLKETLDKDEDPKDVRFRMKDKGWHSCAVQVTGVNEVHRIPNRECTYQQLHFQGIATNKICGVCPFDSFNREGDITLGDYWGIENYDNSLTDDKGTSIVLVNTTKGAAILKKISCNLKLIRQTPADWTVRGNANIVQPIRHLNRRQFFWQHDKLSLRDNYLSCKEDKCDCIIFNNAITEINYGSMLTAYALQELILGFGLYPKILNHARVKMNHYQNSFAERFAVEYFNLTEPCETEADFAALNKKTDNFIVGSDQMWRTCYWKEKVDKILLDFVQPGKKKIACAISFGVKEFEGTEEEKRHFRESLKSYTAISVREDSGVDICDKEFSSSATWILDPVFIVDSSIWESLSNKSLSDSKGSLCYYGWIYDKKRVDILQEIANKNNCDDVINITGKGISVEEWLSAIRKCKVFVSDSYHGICFAMIFKKPFICISELGQDRFDSLSRLLKVGNFVITDTALNADVCPTVFDYDKVGQVLSAERVRSAEFIRSALMS